MADNKLFSPESEVNVIANILKCPSLIHSTDGLRQYMFSSANFQIMFGEFEELKNDNTLPDPQIVIASLESKNRLDKVGGKKEIERLVSLDVKEDAFEKFVEIIVASYKGRQYLSVLANGKKEDLNLENIDTKIQLTRQSLDDLVGIGGGNHTVHVSELTRNTYDAIIARMQKPGISGTTWGFSSLDKATGGKSPGDLVIIAGRPGSGKTSAICNSYLQDGLAGTPALMISREMRPPQLVERLVSIDTGISGMNIKLGVLNQAQVDKIYASLEKIKKLPLYLDYNFMLSDPFYLESTVNKYVKQFGINVVYLDYIQIATERGETQRHDIGRLTALFKGISNHFGITSILASQLNRNVEARDDKRPLLSDMKESGAIEEDADFVIGLYRDEYYYPEATKHKGLMEYILLKQRNGPPGTVMARFDGPTYRITEA